MCAFTGAYQKVEIHQGELIKGAIYCCIRVFLLLIGKMVNTVPYRYYWTCCMLLWYLSSVAHSDNWIISKSRLRKKIYPLPLLALFSYSLKVNATYMHYAELLCSLLIGLLMVIILTLNFFVNPKNFFFLYCHFLFHVVIKRAFEVVVTIVVTVRIRSTWQDYREWFRVHQYHRLRDPYIYYHTYSCSVQGISQVFQGYLHSTRPNWWSLGQ